MSDQRVTAAPETLMEQAGATASVYLRAALHNLDPLCQGRALDYPEIVAAMITAAALDFHAAQINVAGQLVREGLEAVAAKDAV